MIVIAQQGVLQGGWEYIWMAYGLTWVTLGGYSAYLLVRGMQLDNGGKR